MSFILIFLRLPNIPYLAWAKITLFPSVPGIAEPNPYEAEVSDVSQVLLTILEAVTGRSINSDGIIMRTGREFLSIGFD